MKIEHNDQTLDGALQDGYWTFNINTEGDDVIQLLPDLDCDAKTQFTEIQLEYGEERTSFEIPKITPGSVTGMFKKIDDLAYIVSDEETGLSTRVFQLGGAWAVQNLNSENDIISQINLIEDMARIKAKFIHLSGMSLIDEAIIESSHIKSLTADKLTAGTISGININGSTFRTVGANGFEIELSNGNMRFFNETNQVGSMRASTSSNYVPNGISILQSPGYIFSLNSESVVNPGWSTAVVQIPETSTSESRKLNINAEGGLNISSDTLGIFNGLVRTKVPLQAIAGYKASHGENSIIQRAGDMMLWLDETSVGGVPIHRIAPRKKDGTWVDSGLGFYEDGRVAVIVNGVWKQL